ncbi:MAG TPA: oligosaccharide flippase family protein [Bacteroidales bacterium]|nr:oligosaccharide flippase family protein [Bacteroidales bacterium]MDI9552271.1 oligosaccharide flippase family protein [Bacteroidota bacterium]MZP66624.1 oligosaccharide flippase family protein [Bacteroidales bacterium]NLK53809.1 oligosaccharide flippase family protein [Bacteroidales bacterium]HNY52378.1 oligosaccharide flippase family protein [Bacteroidales bacterium]
MRKIKLIDNIKGLQLFQLMKFVVFLIISIVFTKSHLTRSEIGAWEMFLFISGLISFFWVTGIIQSLLPLYHRNRTYRKTGDNGSGKSPEIFNAFLLLSFFSLMVFAIGHALKSNFSVFHMSGNVPYLNLLLLYVLLSSPVCLIEYIYLLNNRSYRIFQYGLYTFGVQLIFVLAPILMGKDIIWGVYGLLAVTGVRWIWLIVLLRRYAEIKISAEFMREHFYLGLPLIITTLISGSAQYIDGIIVSAVYRDPGWFAWFRYGAKEFPLAVMLANGLNNAMLPEFSTRTQMKESLAKIKEKSRGLMHICFPSTMLIMLLARWIYPRMFTPEFQKSADIFLLYSLLVIPRMVFPHTIIVGRKKTHITMIAAILEIGLNIPFSLLMIKWGYNIVGVALATFVVYLISRLYLIIYVWVKMKIRPSEYIPIKIFMLYSFLLGLLFVLIDHRIIDIH